VSKTFASEGSEHTHWVETIEDSVSASVRDLGQRGGDHGRRRESTWETIGNRDHGKEKEWRGKKNSGVLIGTIERDIGIGPFCQILPFIGACVGLRGDERTERAQRKLTKTMQR
jgi:hypothetical protein